MAGLNALDKELRARSAGPSRAAPMRLALLALLAASACKPAAKSPYVQVVVGDMHACARRADGRVACWGVNSYAQLGAEDPNESGPLLVPFIRGATDIAVVDRATTCAVVGRGEVECWGTVWTQLSDWRQRIPGVRGAVRVLGGGFRACAIAADGTATCWGPAPADRPNSMQGWPPAPDERMRGATVAVAVGSKLCARVPGGAFCTPTQDWAKPEPLEATEFARLYGGADSLCRIARGRVSCEGLQRSLPATVHGLVATGDAVCGLDAGGTVLCISRTDLDSSPKYLPRIAWSPMEGFATNSNLVGGPFGICALDRGGVRCADPPKRAVAEVLLP